MLRRFAMAPRFYGQGVVMTTPSILNPGLRKRRDDDGGYKNLYLAIGLSCLVIVGWSYFFAPKPNPARIAEIQRQAAQPQATPGEAPAGAPGASGHSSARSRSRRRGAPKTRAEALAASPRIKIDTPALSGSLAAEGRAARRCRPQGLSRDDQPLRARTSSCSRPPGAPDAYYAEAGFLAPSGETLALPRADTLWQADRDTLTPQTPVTLTYDDGQGLVFHRQIAVDDRYMFTIHDSVENKSDKPVTLAPYALVARQGLPKTANYSVLHEGFVGVIGDGGVEEIKYDKIEKEDRRREGVLGRRRLARLHRQILGRGRHSGPEGAGRGALFGRARAVRPEELSAPISPARRRRIAPGATVEAMSRVFAGAKEVATLDRYQADLGIKKFDLLIDWGWFYFITKPMFRLLHFIYQLTRQFRRRNPDRRRSWSRPCSSRSPTRAICRWPR